MMERIRRMMGVSGVILIIVVGCGVQTPTAPPVTATASATARPASTSTPTPEPTSTSTPTSTPTPEPTATPEEETLASLEEELFSEGGRLESDNMSVAFSQEVMDFAGVEKVSLNQDVLEDIRGIMLGYWAWEAAKTDDRLSVFENIDPKYLEEVLKAYDENYDLIEGNYPFDFGHGVKGPVDKIVIRVVSPEEWDLVSQAIRQTGLPETRERPQIPPIPKNSFFFTREGVLNIWVEMGNLSVADQEDLRSKELGKVWDILTELYFVAPTLTGGYRIGEVIRGSHDFYELPDAHLTFEDKE